MNNPEQETKLFEPDFSKTRYTIIIKVHQNCSSFTIEKPDENEMPTYQDAIGQLEISKYNLIYKQREENIKAAKKLKSKKSKK